LQRGDGATQVMNLQTALGERDIEVNTLTGQVG
jgi:hypothetical protein